MNGKPDDPSNGRCEWDCLGSTVASLIALAIVVGAIVHPQTSGLAVAVVILGLAGIALAAFAVRPQGRESKPFQFGLASMFALTAAVAVLVWATPRPLVPEVVAPAILIAFPFIVLGAIAWIVESGYRNH